MDSQGSPKPRLGGATTFPLIIYFVLGMGPAPKWHFVPGLLSGSLEIPKVGTSATLGAHNFIYKPSIEMRFKAKL